MDDTTQQPAPQIGHEREQRHALWIALGLCVLVAIAVVAWHYVPRGAAPAASPEAALLQSATAPSASSTPPSAELLKSATAPAKPPKGSTAVNPADLTAP